MRRCKNECDIDKNGYFHKDEFTEVILENKDFRSMLVDSINNIRKVDKMIENDLAEHFQTWIPLTNNM